MLKLLTIYRKPTESDFSGFESEFKIKIPENYKKFLNKINGGVVDDENCTNPFDIDSFYSTEFLGKNCTIFTVRRDHIDLEQNLPSNIFPIGQDMGSNFISIIIDNSSDHSKIRVDYMEDEEFAILANSLEELLGVENIEDFPNYYSE